ncbi:MAG TPA: GNAT family N-acetyltransferase [Aliidongia sp.]|nr:GNAT family N-acetyltransferase [Aliidongia sp.]
MPAIRAATADDALAIAQVHVACWHEAYAGLLPEAVIAARTVAAREAMWRRILTEAGPAGIFVADDDGTLIGFGACGPQRSAELSDFDAEIGTLYLRSARHGRGLGRALMQAMFRDLRERGFAAASLWVLDGNDGAMRFYERLGGVRVGERTETDEHGTFRDIAYGWRDLVLT